jgi:hypothetical protein
MNQRQWLSFGWIVIAGAMLGADQPGASGPAPKPAAALIADPDWTPKAGDQAEIQEDNAPAIWNDRTYRDFAKSLEAGDTVGINKLTAQKMLVRLAKGTQVLILKRYRPESSRGPWTIGNAIQTALDGPGPRGKYPLEVRVIDGPHKDQVWFVPEESVAHMIPAPQPKTRKSARKPAPAAKPVDPAVRATTLLRSARNLEEARKNAGALTLYRSVVQDYPGTPQAATASERIKVLGGP